MNSNCKYRAIAEGYAEEDSSEKKSPLNRAAGGAIGAASGAAAGGLAGRVVGHIHNRFDPDLKNARQQIRVAKTTLKAAKQAKKLREIKNDANARDSLDMGIAQGALAVDQAKKEYAKRANTRVNKYGKIGAAAGAGFVGVRGAQLGGDEVINRYKTSFGSLKRRVH